MSDSLKEALVRHLDQVSQQSEDALVVQRYERLRGQGVYRAAN
jgi:acetyl-CoA carboxylase alpha subunit